MTKKRRAVPKKRTQGVRKVSPSDDFREQLDGQEQDEERVIQDILGDLELFDPTAVKPEEPIELFDTTVASLRSQTGDDAATLQLFDPYTWNETIKAELGRDMYRPRDGEWECAYGCPGVVILYANNGNPTHVWNCPYWWSEGIEQTPF